MTDEKGPFGMEDSHEVFEQYPSAFQEQPDAEQHLQYAYSEQQPQYSYTEQDTYPHADQQPQYPYAPQQTQYPYGNQPMPPAYTYPNGAAPKKSSPISITALVLGILSCLLPIVAPVAIVLGIIGIVQAKNTGANKGMGIVGLVLGLVVTLFWVALIAVAVHSINRPYPDPSPYPDPEGKPSVSSDVVDVEFGTYDEYNGHYGLPVTITNTSPDVLRIDVEIQAQTKDDNKLLEDTRISAIALRPGYSYTETAFGYLLDADNDDIKDATFVTTEITAKTQKINDIDGKITLGDLTYKKTSGYVYKWETNMDVTYTNTTSVPKEICSVDISANDPHTKEALYFDSVYFNDVQPGKSMTESAFEYLPSSDETEDAPWFTRKGLEYDIADMSCY